MNKTKISTSDIKELRDKTGAGMMDCKKALTESGGDFDKAIDILRKEGQKLSEKRAGREATEGVVMAKISENDQKGVIIKLSCETDFVAKNDDFIAIAGEMADIALENFPDSLDELHQQKIGDITIEEKIAEQVGIIGEKIQLDEYEALEAEQVVSYIHMGYKAGVLVGFNKSGDDYREAGRNVAMQVAAMKPIALDREHVDQETIDREKEIAKEQALKEGKPEHIVDRIVEGKLNKFFEEKTLVNQEYVKQKKTSIADYLKSVDSDLEVTDFRHVELG